MMESFPIKRKTAEKSAAEQFMNQFEKAEPKKEQEISVAEREKVRDLFFRQYIETEMESELFNEIKKGGLDDAQINELRKSFSALNDQEKEFAYALPYELRKRNFKFQAGQIKAGKKSIDQFWDSVIKIGLQTGRRLGYHLSPYDIPPTKNKINGEDEWFINGTEQDHRNSDNPMAYYSEDYNNLYRTKGGTHLYVISSQRGSGTGHYVDNTNHWGRASTLAVVQKFDMRKVDAFVNEQTAEYFNQKKTPDQP